MHAERFVLKDHTLLYCCVEKIHEYVLCGWGIEDTRDKPRKRSTPDASSVPEPVTPDQKQSKQNCFCTTKHNLNVYLNAEDAADNCNKNI